MPDLRGERLSPIVLVVLDGWGEAPASDAGNAIARAGLEVLPSLRASSPSARLEASGGAVGLPPDQWDAGRMHQWTSSISGGNGGGGGGANNNQHQQSADDNYWGNQHQGESSESMQSADENYWVNYSPEKQGGWGEGDAEADGNPAKRQKLG